MKRTLLLAGLLSSSLLVLSQTFTFRDPFWVARLNPAGSAAFYPTNIANCTYWLSAGIGAFEDVEGTDAVEDGDDVWNWSNKGLLGGAVTNKWYATNAPTYRSAITFGTASFPALDFCSDQQASKGKGLTVGGLSPLSVFGYDKCHIFVVAQLRTNANGLSSLLFALPQDSSSNRVSAAVNLDSGPSVVWTWQGTAADGRIVGSGNADTNWMLWEWIHNSTSGGSIKTNGVAYASSAAGSTNRYNVASAFWIGNLSGTVPLEGQMAEMIVYTNYITGSDLTSVTNYLNTKYDLW